jgi:uncharacterized protein YhbP (UPF0306 family)
VAVPEAGRRALAYLESHWVMTLATTGPDGPWAAAVFYASQGFRLVFLSAGHTRHARNLAGAGQAAAAIHEEVRDWTAIQGLQLEGQVIRLQGDERERAMALYGRKFPFIGGEATLQAALARASWYRLSPDRLYFIDNSRGLGHRDEIDLSLLGDDVRP